MSDIRVLVVDDDETILGLMKRFFSQRGDICTVASSGAAALRLIEDRFFDLLLTDIIMPGMDGLELVRRARALQPHTVCILMSGMGRRGDIISALKAGVFDFLDKPITDLAEFTMIIDRAAAGSRLMQERDALLENLKQQNSRLEFSLLRLHEAFGQLRQQEEALKSDLVKAQHLQRKLLPAAFPRIDGLDLFGYYGPCDHLGGDFFGVIPLEDGRIATYMADVTGHGVSAAMVTVVLRELMRAPQRAGHSDLFGSPADLLAFINDALLAEAFNPPIFASMVYAIFDPASGRAIVASAGHPPPLVISAPAKECFLPVPGRVLGIRHSERFETAEVLLRPGDAMLLYSDGLTEARSEAGAEFTPARLVQTLHRCHGWPAAKTGEAVEQAMLDHLGGMPPADDITFIVACRSNPVEANGSQPSPRETAFAPNSVKLAMPHQLRYIPPETRGRIKGGWREKVCIIRLAGVATWQLAATLREMLGKAKSDAATAVQIDLGECEALDSTMLGLLLQHVGEITLHQPPSRIVGQLHEMGVLGLFEIDHTPCPPPQAPLPIEPGDMRETCSDLILSAHEALMEASASNHQRFKEVVSVLRQKNPAADPS